MKFKIDEVQRYLFSEGSNAYAYHFMGAHPCDVGGEPGYSFAVWAPQAKRVSLVGDFNQWDTEANPMERQEGGIFTAVAPVLCGAAYKYAILTASDEWIWKADPYAFYAELKPRTASRTFDLSGYEWHDAEWMESRRRFDPYHSPVNIYELHAGSWQMESEGGRRRQLTYAELAERLVPYVVSMGYTHIQLLPVMEHPLDMSWGYQVTGFYAPTSRYGTPHDLMALVDAFHRAGIGVLLDWVPGHFPKDSHGLRRFDGSPLYEPEDSLRGEHAGWGTHLFNYERDEVRSFLLSNACYWLDMYHADGLRVDAVSAMLYHSFQRDEWRPNKYGGIENLEAIALLRKLNTLVYRDFPGVLMTAEESTAYPMVTKPTYVGGLGFGFKWNMGWMNDILKYISMDPVYRKYHHYELTFSLTYAFAENYILALSHDEVVHGKMSMLDKNPGDYWQKFAGLRALYGYMMAHPGKKLLFMGGEFGQFIEWKYDDSLDFHLLEYPMHRAMWEYVRELNHFYRSSAALWQLDDTPMGFDWINGSDTENSVVSFMRSDAEGGRLVCVINFTHVYHPLYRIGLPERGTLRPVFNSDDERFGGSGKGCATLHTEDVIWNEMPFSAHITVPPLAAIFFEFIAEATKKDYFKAGKPNPL